MLTSIGSDSRIGSEVKHKDGKMEIRRVSLGGFRTIGRIFKNGDIIMLDNGCDNLIHVYTGDDSLLPEVLESPISNISREHMEKLINSSVLILE